MRFQAPSEGIWKIRVFNETNGSAFFDMWLPIRNFLPQTTYFLRADPDITLCDPSNNPGIISTAYYNSSNDSISIDSSRGFTRNGNSIYTTVGSSIKSTVSFEPILGTVRPLYSPLGDIIPTETSCT